MNSLPFLKTEVAAALDRGVSQYVLMGSSPALRQALEASTEAVVQVFALAQEQTSLPVDSSASTESESEALDAVLAKSGFNGRKASLFLWLGGAGYRTIEAAIASLAFIASLPKGSGVILDYAEERSSIGSFTHTALDALASRIAMAGAGVKYLIQPQAVATLLHSVGFQKIVDQERPSSGAHLVSALV